MLFFATAFALVKRQYNLPNIPNNLPNIPANIPAIPANIPANVPAIVPIALPTVLLNNLPFALPTTLPSKNIVVQDLYKFIPFGLNITGNFTIEQQNQRKNAENQVIANPVMVPLVPNIAGIINGYLGVVASTTTTTRTMNNAKVSTSTKVSHETVVPAANHSSGQMIIASIAVVAISGALNLLS